MKNSRMFAIAAATAVTVAAAAFATPAMAAVGDGSVSPTAATWTPSLATSGTDGTVEQIRQVAQCGTTMYAVGGFSSIKQKSSTYARANAFSFAATTGAMTGWAPNVNGKISTVALSTDCSTAYLGGSFTVINGTTVKNIAAVDTTTGNVLSSFAHTASAKVSTLALVGTHLLVGGSFTSINGSSRKYFASLSSTTGKDDGYLNLNISGTYVYTDDGGQLSRSNSTSVFNTDVSPDGSRVLVMGVFTSVGGQARRQIFMLDLGAASASVDPWYSLEFDQNCHVVEPFYLQAASWAPDMTKVYIATTGYSRPTGSATTPVIVADGAACATRRPHFRADLRPHRSMTGSITPDATRCTPRLRTGARSTWGGTSDGSTAPCSATATATAPRSTLPGWGASTRYLVT